MSRFSGSKRRSRKSLRADFQKLQRLRRQTVNRIPAVNCPKRVPDLSVPRRKRLGACAALGVECDLVPALCNAIDAQVAGVFGDKFDDAADSGTA